MGLHALVSTAVPIELHLTRSKISWSINIEMPGNLKYNEYSICLVTCCEAVARQILAQLSYWPPGGTQDWQYCHYCQMCIPIYLQFSSLFTLKEILTLKPRADITSLKQKPYITIWVQSSVNFLTFLQIIFC